VICDKNVLKSLCAHIYLLSSSQVQLSTNFQCIMTTKTTLNCVKSLLNHEMKFSDILVSNPTVSMRTLCSPRLKLRKHVACHTETSNTSSEDWFNWFYKTESPTEIAGQIKHVRSRTSHKHWRRFQKPFSPNLCCNLFIHNLTIIDLSTFLLACLHPVLLTKSVAKQ